MQPSGKDVDFRTQPSKRYMQDFVGSVNANRR